MGHGAGDEVDKAAIERYLRAVDRGFRERIGSTRQPVVLASVSYYLPILQSVSSCPSIVDAVVEGNPEHRSPEELHAAAWPLVERHFAEETEKDLDRYGAAAGSSTAATATDEVADAARGGRVDTLFVVSGAPPDERVDRAVLDTLARVGGSSEWLSRSTPTRPWQRSCGTDPQHPRRREPTNRPRDTAIVEQCSSLDARLRSFPAESFDLELSLKERDMRSQHTVLAQVDRGDAGHRRSPPLSGATA